MGTFGQTSMIEATFGGDYNPLAPNTAAVDRDVSFDGSLSYAIQMNTDASYLIELSGGTFYTLTDDQERFVTDNDGLFADFRFLSTGSLQASGGNRGDKFIGGGGSDELHGNGGNDILVGGMSGDALDGGDGIDTASYETARQGVFASLTTPQFNSADAFGDSYISIENLRGSAFDDILVGDGGANILWSNGGRDALYGEGGNDKFMITASPGSLDGGAGTDTLIVGTGSAVQLTDPIASIETVVVLVSASFDMSALGTNEYDGKIAAIRSRSVQGGDVTIVGSQKSDTIVGGKGSDLLFGKGGNDDIVIYGAARIDGGDGYDTVRIKSATSLLAFDDWTLANVERVVVGSGVSIDAAQVSHALKIVGTGTLSHNLRGSSAADTIIGGSGTDFMDGNGGTDVVRGGQGNDFINGNAGADFLRGDAGTDTFVFTSLSDMADARGRIDRILDFTSADGDKIDFTRLDADAAVDGQQRFTFIDTDAFTPGSANYEVRVQTVGSTYLLQFDVDHDGSSDHALIVIGAAPLSASDFIGTTNGIGDS